jgi:hypothetical protein
MSAAWLSELDTDAETEPLEQARAMQRNVASASSLARKAFSRPAGPTTARAGGIANPLLRAISSDSDSFIRQHLSHEDRVAVPIHPKPGETAMAQPATASAKPGAEAKVKDSIDHLRSAAQDLHKSISDATAKRSGATKAEIAGLSEKAKAVAQSAKASIDAKQGNAAKHLTDAVNHLEATQAHLSESLKATGVAFDTSVKKVLMEARASVQKISEAVAERRTATSGNKK